MKDANGRKPRTPSLDVQPFRLLTKSLLKEWSTEEWSTTRPEPCQ